MSYVITESDKKAIEEGCYYDQSAADRAIRFIETYYSASTVGKEIQLLDWQRSFVSRLYGWRLKNGKRRHKKAILSTAKKNGKTLLQSGILLYEMLGAGVASPFCVSASTTRENAGQLYRELAYSIRHNDKLSKLCKCLDSTKEIRPKDKNREPFRYKAFSADAGGAEGENISALVVDELHAHVSDKLYRSLEYATIARPDSFVCVISTAGTDQGHIWYSLFKYAEGVQKGTIIDTSVLPLIYSAPPDADIDDPATWYAANPSLGVSFSEEDFKRDLDRAKQEGTAALLSWRRYRLNQWTRPDDSFIDPALFDANTRHIPDDELKSYPLWIGADLASTTDTSAVAEVFALGNRRYHVRCHSWCCESGVRKREATNLPRYQTYAADKVLTITEGTCTDFRLIRRHIAELRNRHNLKAAVFDMWNATEITNELMADGFPVHRQYQGHKDYTAAVKEFEVALKEGRVTFEPNPMLRWCLHNARLDVNHNGDCKPDRGKSTDKIDPVVALLMAFGKCVADNSSQVDMDSVYNYRGVIRI
jgi:phage terminase large subunit-like protein